MRSQSPLIRWPRLAASALAAVVFLAPTPSLASANADSERVDCKLPPQIRSLDGNMSYLAAGRQVHIPVAECKQRGGSWNGGGPGAYAGASGSLAVTVGGQGEVAACPLLGRVVGLSGGSTLAVRAGPGRQFARVDRLTNGRQVFICDRVGDADWVGIVYASDPHDDCGLSAPISPARAYTGSCHAGWVRSNFLQ